MPIAYFDCASGVAGDMILGALVDAGLSMTHLNKILSTIQIGKYRIVKKVKKTPIKGVNIFVDVKQDVQITFSEINAIFSNSKFPSGVAILAKQIFAKMAEAESKVHGVPVEDVHFHELGSLDSIIDIAGAAIGFEYFGFSAVYASPIPMTRGTVSTKHGIMSVPAPAALELLKGIPLERCSIRDEIVTPTGIAVLSTLCESFGECPIQHVGKVAYGYGDKIFDKIPNALRLIVGDGFPTVKIETNIDDMNPEIFDYVMSKLFDAGAVDVSFEPIQMKKNRLGVKINVLSPWSFKDEVIDVLLHETTTFGVRYYPVNRRVLKRELKRGKLKFKGVSFKLGMDDNKNIVKAIPEHGDIRKMAKKMKISMVEAYQIASSYSLELKGKKS